MHPNVTRHAQRCRMCVCCATLSGVVRPDARPICPAWQLSRAIIKDAATFCAAPLWLARQKEVSQVNFFIKSLFFKFVYTLGYFRSNCLTLKHRHLICLQGKGQAWTLRVSVRFTSASTCTDHPPMTTAVAETFECFVVASRNHTYLRRWCDTNKPKHLIRLASSR
jgi:hypothetical protein